MQHTVPPLVVRSRTPAIRSILVPPHIDTFDLPLGDCTIRLRTIAIDPPAPDARPTLVFLHDSLGSITVWRDFPDRLAAMLGCDALVYDRRGYGGSSAFGPAPRTPRYLEQEADELIRVLDACDLGDVLLFGHSDGGSIALVAASRHPERVRGVVTEGAHVFVEELTLAGIRAAREALQSTDLRERLTRHHGERTDGVLSAWIDTWLSPEFRAWNIETYLPGVRCPALVLQGALDEYGTPAQVHAIAEGVSGPVARVLMRGVGHSPHRDAPDETLRLTRAFLVETIAELGSAPEQPSAAG